MSIESFGDGVHLKKLPILFKLRADRVFTTSAENVCVHLCTVCNNIIEYEYKNNILNHFKMVVNTFVYHLKPSYGVKRLQPNAMLKRPKFN